jgi:hypothetical protein
MSANCIFVDAHVGAALTTSKLRRRRKVPAIGLLEASPGRRGWRWPSVGRQKSKGVVRPRRYGALRHFHPTAPVPVSAEAADPHGFPPWKISGPLALSGGTESTLGVGWFQAIRLSPQEPPTYRLLFRCLTAQTCPAGSLRGDGWPEPLAAGTRARSASVMMIVLSILVCVSAALFLAHALDAYAP